MKAKDFVLSKYPDAVSFRWVYDNRLMRPTYCILDSSKGLSILFYNPNGSNSESAAWTFAKKQILEIGKSNQEL